MRMLAIHASLGNLRRKEAVSAKRTLLVPSLLRGRATRRSVRSVTSQAGVKQCAPCAQCLPTLINWARLSALRAWRGVSHPRKDLRGKSSVSLLRATLSPPSGHWS